MVGTEVYASRNAARAEAGAACLARLDVYFAILYVRSPAAFLEDSMQPSVQGLTEPSARAGWDTRMRHTAWNGALRFIWCKPRWDTPQSQPLADISTRGQVNPAPSSSWRVKPSWCENRLFCLENHSESLTFVGFRHRNYEF